MEAGRDAISTYNYRCLRVIQESHAAILASCNITSPTDVRNDSQLLQNQNESQSKKLIDLSNGGHTQDLLPTGYTGQPEGNDTNTGTNRVNACSQAILYGLQLVDECHKRCTSSNNCTKTPSLPMSDLGNAIVFASTTYTTIGYGNIYPTTTACKVATIIYTLIGVPYFLALLQAVGRWLRLKFVRFWNWAWRALHRKLRCRAKVDSVQHETLLRDSQGSKPRAVTRSFPLSLLCRFRQKVFPFCRTKDHPPDDFDSNSGLRIKGRHVRWFPFLIGCTVAMTYLFLQSLVLKLMIGAELSMFDCFYFLIMSVTLVGFGDVFPSNPRLVLYNSFALLLAICLISMCFFILQESMMKEATATADRVSASVQVLRRKMSKEFVQPFREGTMGIRARGYFSSLRGPRSEPDFRMRASGLGSRLGYSIRRRTTHRRKRRRSNSRDYPEINVQDQANAMPPARKCRLPRDRVRFNAGSDTSLEDIPAYMLKKPRVTFFKASTESLRRSSSKFRNRHSRKKTCLSTTNSTEIENVNENDGNDISQATKECRLQTSNESINITQISELSQGSSFANVETAKKSSIKTSGILLPSSRSFEIFSPNGNLSPDISFNVTDTQNSAQQPVTSGTIAFEFDEDTFNLVSDNMPVRPTLHNHSGNNDGSYADHDNVRAKRKRTINSSRKPKLGMFRRCNSETVPRRKCASVHALRSPMNELSLSTTQTFGPEISDAVTNVDAETIQCGFGNDARNIIDNSSNNNNIDGDNGNDDYNNRNNVTSKKESIVLRNLEFCNTDLGNKCTTMQNGIHQSNSALSLPDVHRNCRHINKAHSKISEPAFKHPLFYNNGVAEPLLNSKEPPTKETPPDRNAGLVALSKLATLNGAKETFL